MKKTPRMKKATITPAPLPDTYADFASDIAALLDEARRQAARSINAVLTAILHAALDETFLFVCRATGNKQTFDATPMTGTSLKD